MVGEPEFRVQMEIGVCAVASEKVDRCDVDDAVAAYSPRDDGCPSWILERNEQG
jgi:hypothetical protein